MNLTIVIDYFLVSMLHKRMESLFLLQTIALLIEAYSVCTWPLTSEFHTKKECTTNAKTVQSS